MKLYFPFICLLFLSAGHLSAQTKADSVRSAVQRQMDAFPKSTLRDIYKSFFQEQFGPGHLIQDTASAGRYLRGELSKCSADDTLFFEPTGLDRNFYRVNLAVVKNGMVPYGVYFKAFMEGANRDSHISMDEWKAEWAFVERIIGTMDLHLVGYEKDREEIAALLEQGKYAMHHSRIYNETYHPHYRIIPKTTFERDILWRITK